MASSIRVVFEVDNRKYIADVKRAEDATTKFAKTTTTSLDSVKPRLAELSGKFAGFAASIAALGFGAAIANAVKYANSINDITEATGVATDVVMGFSNAVALNGGSAEAAQKGIIKLANSIEDAASGSKTAQMAFSEVGVSLNDLASLSEQDILKKTIDGLGRLNDSSKRVALTTQLLGKELGRSNIRGTAADFDGAVASAQRYNNVISQSKEIHGKFERAVQQVQLSVLRAIEPMLEFANSLTPEQIDKMAEGLVDVAKGLAGFAAAVTALKGLTVVLGVLGGAFALAKTGVAGIATASVLAVAAYASLNKTFLITKGYLERFSKGVGMFKAENGAAKNFDTLMQKLGERPKHLAEGLKKASTAGGGFLAGLGRIVPAAASVVALLYSLNEAIKLFTNSQGITSWGNVFVNTMARATEAVGLFAAEILNLPTDALAGLLRLVGVKIDNPFGLGDGLKNVVNQAKLAREEVERIALLDSLNKNRVAVAGPGVDVATGRPATRAQDAGPVRPVKLAGFKELDALNNELRAIKEISAEYEKQRATTLKKLDLETSLIGKTEEQKQLAEAQHQLAQDFLDVQDQLIKKRDSLSKEDLAQGKLLPAINEQLKKNAQAYNGQLTALNKTVAANQHSLMLEKNRQQEIKNIVEAMEQQAEFAREIAELQNQQGAAKIQAFELLDTQKESFDLLMRREELERGILNLREQDKTAATQLFELENDRKKQLEEIRKIQNLPFEGVGGMKQRLQEINDLYDARRAQIEATAAATKAEQDSFASGWANAGEKFRNNIKRDAEYAAQQLSNFTKGFEDAFVKFVQTGKLSFKDLANSMIADFARIQAQRLLTSFMGGGGGGGGFFGSIGKIFGFANGGMPPVGVPSLVGERGPELFVPQNAGKIIPNHKLGLGGQSVINNTTEVSYNIQAVDSASFQQLVASDPKFLHAVVEKGRRSLPQGGRR
jgi:lambda family phage tail tape measure protein